MNTGESVSLDRRGKECVYSTFTDVERRTHKFRSQPRQVQLVTLALLDQRVASTGSGFLSAAFAPSIALAAALITVVVSLSIAQYNSLSAAILRLTDPTTGKVHGITNAAYKADVMEITQPLVWVGLVTVVVVIAILTVARIVDKRRSSAMAWLRVFEAEMRPGRESNSREVARAAIRRSRP